MEINTVLIVDDDEAVLDTLSKVVKSNDFEAVTAQSGEEALKLMETNQYCIVLLDINMHGISGFDVLEAMRKQGNHTPVIIISARQEDWDTIYGLTAGADDYITKPFNPVTLGAKIKAVIRRTNCEKKPNRSHLQDPLPSIIPPCVFLKTIPRSFLPEKKTP